MQISVKSDLKELTKELKRKQRDLIPKATGMALNKVGAKAFTIAKRTVAKEMGIAQKALKKSFRLIKSNKNRLQIDIEGTGSPLPLIEFGAKQPKQSKFTKNGKKARKIKNGGGVTAKPYGKLQYIEGAFIAKMKSGHVGVYKRSTSKRLPIQEKFGPGVPKTLGGKITRAAIKKSVEDNFKGEFTSAFNLLESRRKK